jgi:hypothetical protein
MNLRGILFRKSFLGRASGLLVFAALFFGMARAQGCQQANEIEPGIRAEIDNAALQYIQFAVHGDVQSLRQASIPLLANQFGSVQQAVTHDRGLLGDQVTIRREYLLDASKATTRLASAEFFCGAYGPNGHTPSTAGFAIPSLDPGLYALVLTNVGGGKLPYMATVVLQKLQGQWKLAGYYPKPTEAAGHDAAWYVVQARQFKQSGQIVNAWLYYVLGWDIYCPVDFMSSLQLDKLSGEIQDSRPAGLPVSGPVSLGAANGRSYTLTQMFAAPDDRGELSLVVRYEVPSVANTAQAEQDNITVIKAIVAKYPEVRAAYSCIVARATTPGGQDYGTLLKMTDIFRQ